MARESIADMIATEVAERIERIAEQVAGALLDSPLAPQVVQPQPSRAEMQAYYASPRFQALLYNADGSPNTAGRQSLIDQVGADAYAQIALALVDHHHQQVDAILAAEPPAGSAPTGGGGVGSNVPAIPGVPLPPTPPVLHALPGRRGYLNLALAQLPDATGVPAMATPGGS